MSRRAEERLDDILESAELIGAHLKRGDLDDPLVRDAVEKRLIVIGEAVKDLPAEMTDSEPTIPWKSIAGMKDWLTHHYFDVDSLTLQETVNNDLPPMVEAAKRMKEASSPTSS
jgi:uncharacterized protein with HEPN domain